MRRAALAPPVIACVAARRCIGTRRTE